MKNNILSILVSLQAWLALLRELQSAMGEELDALLPSVLDRAGREIPNGLYRTTDYDTGS